MKGAIKGDWRCVTPPNDDGFVGVAVNGEDGCVYRFLLHCDDARHIAESILDYLDTTREDRRGCLALQDLPRSTA